MISLYDPFFLWHREWRSDRNSSLSPYSSLYRSSYQPLPPPTFHSHFGTLVFILPSCRPSAFITPFPSHSSSTSLHSSQLCSVIFALSCLFPNFILSCLEYWFGREHTQSPVCAQTHTAELPSLPCPRWSHHKHTHNSITSILVSSSHCEIHRDI